MSRRTVMVQLEGEPERRGPTPRGGPRKWWGSWRVAARIARRDAVRARGRTALVATMIGLPVLAGVVGGVLIQSSMVTPARRVAWEMGPQVQAVVSRYDAPGLSQSGDGSATGMSNAQPTASPPTVADYERELAAALPPGDRLVRSVTGAAHVATADKGAEGGRQVRELPVDAMASVVVEPVAEGALPAAPDEAAVGHALSSELGLHVGDLITLTKSDGSQKQLRVSGLLAPWWQDNQEEVIAVSGAFLGTPDSAHPLDWLGLSWDVVGGTSVTWKDVTAINALGSSVRSRAVILDPSDVVVTGGLEVGGGPSAGMIGIIAGVAAMGLIEAVLLIGPAFAVGARRSQRQLALLAATGGDRRTLRRVVLLGGGIVGFGAGAVGAALGLVVAIAIRAVVVLRGSFVLPDLRIPWWSIPVMVALGALVALAAAALPARRASRADTVAALAGRRAEARPHRGVPVAGIVLAAAGAALALAGATTRRPALLVVGVLALEIGLVLASGALVTLVGRLAPHLGVAGRFAARDAARQRGRTAPALAAVIAALAGLTAGVVYVQSQIAQENASHSPLGADGTVALGASPMFGDEPAASGDDFVAAAAVLRRDLPVSEVAVVRLAVRDAGGATSGSPSAVPPGAGMSPTASLVVLRAPENECAPAPDGTVAQPDPRCAGNLGTSGTVAWNDPHVYAHWLVDDGTVVRALRLPSSERAAQALAAGRAVVQSPYDLQPDGTVHLQVLGRDGETVVEARVPAVVGDLENHQQIDLVLPPSALAPLGLTSAVAGLVASTTNPPTVDEIATANADLDPRFPWSLYVERGPYTGLDPMVWILVLVAIALGLAATGVAVALAAAESRADLATLGAVGAAPRSRRRIAAAQAGVLAVTGAVLGVVAGLLLARVLVTAQRYGGRTIDPRWTTVVPWPAVALILVGVPLLAMGGAWVLTRSRLPMVRRIVG